MHVLRALSRCSEDLEINANCLENGLSGGRGKADLLSRSSTSSLTSNGAEGEGFSRIDQQKMRPSAIETVNENEALLGGCASFWEALDHRPAPPEPYIATLIGSASKDESDIIDDAQPLTQSVTESDDYSMGSSSLTATSSLHMLSVASCGAGISSSNYRARLPPLPPSSGSVKTLPIRLSEPQRTRYGGGRSVGANGWSIASMESNDLDADTNKSNVVSPKMMNQMKYYMSRHMAKEK